MFQRFTDRANKVMMLANQEALRLGSNLIHTEHVLLGIAKEGGGFGAQILSSFESDYSTLRGFVEKRTPPKPESGYMGRLALTARAIRVIEFATKVASVDNDGYVATHHLLLGLLQEKDGTAREVIFEDLRITLEAVTEKINSLVTEPIDEGLRRAIEGLEIDFPVTIKPKYGPEQVKTFGPGVPEVEPRIEDQINLWLAENANMKVLEFTAFHYDGRGLMVIYRYRAPENPKSVEWKEKEPT